jgi:hypothetical protein
MTYYPMGIRTAKTHPWSVTYFNHHAERMFVGRYKSKGHLRLGIRKALKRWRPTVDYYIAQGPGFKMLVELKHALQEVHGDHSNLPRLV